MLNNTLKGKLKKVYLVNQDFIDVLQVSGISADEFHYGTLEEDGNADSEMYGIEVITTYQERKLILDHIKFCYDNDMLGKVPNLFN